ncbi:MAG: hypothetical protein Kow00109_02820 [Acidobacteriota bacterium]
MMQQGDAGAAAPQGRATRGKRLEGWKEIANYLDVSVRAAQTWEAKEGLPVHRTDVGRRSRVTAYSHELDAWRRDYDSRTNSAETSGRRSRWNAILAASLVAVLIAAGWWSWHTTREQTTSGRDPAYVEVSGGAITVFDASGEVSFVIPVNDVSPHRYTGLSFVVGTGTRLSDQAVFADLEDDGNLEILVRIGFQGEKSDELRCYEADGKLRWSFRNRRTLEFGRRSFMNNSGILFFGAPLQGEDGRHYVLVVLSDRFYFPCGVLLLDPHDGRVRAEYWHPGWFFIGACVLYDWDEDGWEELLLGGVNNPGPGPGRPALAVLDVPFPPSDPRTPNLFGLPGGQEKFYVLFGRTDVWDALRFRVDVVTLRPTTSDEFWIEFKMDAATYRIRTDRHFQPIEAIPPQSFQVLHRNLESEGPLDHELTAEEVREALRPLYFRCAPNANDPQSLQQGVATLEAVLE